MPSGPPPTSMPACVCSPSAPRSRPSRRSPSRAPRCPAHRRHTHGNTLGGKLDTDEVITRALRKSIALSTAALESGLTVLASIGSTAPFVGLFGTVWGIYHALVNISVSGMATLDKVAGPVGEALIMTAFGLFVAIPAVLAYNAITRANRVELSELDAFAHDLHAWFATGSRIAAVPAPHRARPRSPRARRPARTERRDGLRRIQPGRGTRPAERHQHGAADRRHAGAADRVHDHRAATHPLGQDRPAAGLQRAHRAEAGDGRAVDRR